VGFILCQERVNHRTGLCGDEVTIMAAARRIGGIMTGADRDTELLTPIGVIAELDIKKRLSVTVTRPFVISEYPRFSTNKINEIVQTGALADLAVLAAELSNKI
jgi:hypothetical protein